MAYLFTNNSQPFAWISVAKIRQFPNGEIVVNVVNNKESFKRSVKTSHATCKILSKCFILQRVVTLI